MVFNIAVTSTVLEPLQCEDHPSEMWTIHNYPSIICWETSDHSAMLAIGMGAFIVVPLNYLVACVLISDIVFLVPIVGRRNKLWVEPKVVFASSRLSY
eukprot:6404869-Amphidinium_carterae.1